ncbi:MAG: C_GCAxxG_C_C family protein [Bacteroides sp.]|nr:C_GCAxxG_C_C family protein [Bacteroidales bacterium]MBD5315304.1 C_GCAxxG_C_C family protein [Bacteroides sp.]MDE6249416.1 C-GCAxxG-C-C family protein [Paramuribaculum sp.]
MTLQERIDKARELHSVGYTCAQCVAMVFDDITSSQASQPLLAAITSGFGGGFGGSRETCGAISGMTAVNGLAHFTSPADKREVYGSTASLVEQFKSLNGSVICRELRVPGAKPCMTLIEDAITILHNSLTPQE